MNPRAVGVFDSGIGGLTAVREMFRVLPHESIVYFGDTARLPYGSKSRETVTRFSLEISSFLVRQNVKALLVACNTASSYALDTLVQRLDLPVVGVIEPAARVAVEKSPHGRIGVIGTMGTVASGAYPTMIEKLAPGAAVISRACPLFVPLVEEGWIDHKVTHAVAAEYLAVASLVRTLGANLPEVKRILIVCGGRPMATLGGHLPLDQPLDVNDWP